MIGEWKNSSIQLFSIKDDLEDPAMTSLNIRSLLAVAALAVLAACGGSSTPQQAGFTSTASLIGHSAAPVADCEAEGCNQPRIVDGLAEQYRFSAVQQPQPQHEEPVEPTTSTEPLADVAVASEAAPAAPGQAL